MATLYSLGAVTVDGYRTHTGDRITAAPIVTGALVDAELLLADELRRDLALEARTATVPVYPDGRVYPPAYPITVSTLDVDGRALLGATPDAGTFVAMWPDRPTRATVTWTGGYTATTLPATLRHAIYDLARAIAADSPPIPVGATSVSVGDVSVTYGRTSDGSLDAHVPGLSGRVRRYKNRWAA